MLVTVGRVGRAHGVRGELSIDIRTDEPERRFRAGATLLVTPRDGVARSYVLAAVRPHSGRLLVSFDGVADRTAAEALAGAVVASEVDETERPEDPAEFYDHQLVGLEAKTVEGRLIGTVTDVLHLPAQDTLAIAAVDDREVLVPFVVDLVPEIDLDAGHLTVADVQGLLEPGAAEDAGA